MVTATKLKGNLSQVREMVDELVDDVVDEIMDADDARLGYKGQPTAKGTYDAVLFIDQIPGMIKFYALNPELHGHTPLILGSSAIGKTFAVRQGFREAAAALGRPTVDARGEQTFKELHVSQMGPTDVMGVPREDGQGRTLWFPPKMFPLVSALPEHQAAYERSLEHFAATGVNDPAIMEGFPLYGLFLDELTNPPQPSIVHQLFSVIYGKYVADHKMVGDMLVIAAGNRVQDGTNSIYLAKSATSRMMVTEAVARFSGWLHQWAMQPVVVGGEEFTREHPLVIAYLTKETARFSPDNAKVDPMTPYPSPRNWTYVSQLLYAYDRNPGVMDEHTLFAQIAGRVGKPDAQNFWAWREHWQEVPDVARILNSPAEPGEPYGWLPKPWPTKPDVLAVMGTQLVAKLNQRNAQRFMALMSDREKFPSEWAAMTMKLLRPAQKLYPLAQQWDRPGFAKWSANYRHLLF